MGNMLIWHYEGTELIGSGYSKPLETVGLHGKRRCQGNGGLPRGGGLAGSGGCA